LSPDSFGAFYFSGFKKPTQARFMRTKLLFLLIISNFVGYAQIVNIESLRVHQDSLGFSGQEQLSFSLVKNTQRLLQFNNNLALQYRQARHLYFLVSDANLSIGDSDSFENNSYFHFRYSYFLSERLQWENFAQYQSNFLLRIQDRVLIGSGLRYLYVKQENSQLAIGTSVMYEWDNELNRDQNNEAIRGNVYASAAFRKKDRYTFGAIFYYQPNLGHWEDFRFSGQTQFAFKLWKGLQFSVTASANYDAFPVVDPAIPKLTYKLTNGLAYRF
jgi:hypothetical protein